MSVSVAHQWKQSSTVLLYDSGSLMEQNSASMLYAMRANLILLILIHCHGFLCLPPISVCATLIHLICCHCLFNLSPYECLCHYMILGSGIL